MHPLRAFQREHASAARHHINDELGMLPVLKLGSRHVERRIAKRSYEHIFVSEQELSTGVAHRGATIAASTRLMKHEVPVLAMKGGNEGDRGVCSKDLVGDSRHEDT